MSNIEFQMNAAAFLAAQRNALRYLGLCPPSLPTISGVQIVVDRIEIGNNSLRHNQYAEFSVFYEDHGQKVPTANRCTGYQTQLAQDVTVYVTTQDEILARPNQPPAVVVPFTLTLIFDLDFYALDDDCYLKATLSTVEPGPLPVLPPSFAPLTGLPQNIQDQITQYLTQQARPFIHSPAVPVGIGKLAKGTRFLNAGLSVDSQMQRIAFRAQIGGSHTNLDVPWSNFFHGFFPDRLQGFDWGFFVEAGLLTETLKTLVYQKLPKDDNLQAFPGCTYSNAGGQAVLNIDVLLIYHLYRNRDIDIDLSAEADPKVGIQLSVDTPNWLTVDIDYSHLLDSDDPLVNLALDLAHSLGIPVEAIVYQMVGSAAMAELAKTPLEICKQISPTHIQCDKSVRVPQIPGALQTTLTGLLALDDGISLAGSMNVRELIPAVLDTNVQEFQVHAPSISCGPASMALVAAFRQDPSGFAVLHAQAFLENRLENQGTGPINLCNPPIVLEGANGPFPPRAIRTDAQQAPIHIYVDIPAPSQDYYDAPYPLDLLVKTSSGTRLMRFNPPPPVTPQDNDQLVAELLVKLGDCQQLVDPWFGRYNPLWSPRPPENAAVQHLWEVVVSGLPAGETVALVDSDNQELMTAVGTGVPVRLSAMMAPGGERELSIVRVDAQIGPRVHATASTDDSADTLPSDLGTAQRGLEVRQTVLVQLGSIPLPERSQNLVVTNLFSGQCVVAILDEGLAAFDFSNPHRPILVRSWQIEGVRGALNWQDALLVFGHEGVEWIDRAGQRRATYTNCELGSVLDAAGDRQALYALTDESLNIHSKRLCRIGAVPLEGGRSVARIDSKLVVGGRRGLTVFDTANPRRPQGKSFLEDMSVSAVRSTLVGEAGSFVVVPEDEPARLFRFNQEYPEEIANFSGSPWFIETVRLGDLMVKIGADRMSLDIYRFGEMSVI